MFVDVCRSFFLDDLSCRFFVTSIICPLDVLSVDVLSVFAILINNVTFSSLIASVGKETAVFIVVVLLVILLFIFEGVSSSLGGGGLRKAALFYCGTPGPSMNYFARPV